MSRLARCAALTLITGMTFAGHAFAQEDEDDCSVDYPHCLRLDDTEIASLEEVTGTIIEITETPLCESDHAFVTLKLQSSAQARLPQREVYLAPRPFLERNGFPFKIGETVTVFGVSSWHTAAGELTVIQVEWGKNILLLRDGSGRPMWLKNAPTS